MARGGCIAGRRLAAHGVQFEAGNIGDAPETLDREFLNLGDDLAAFGGERDVEDDEIGAGRVAQARVAVTRGGKGPYTARRL